MTPLNITNFATELSSTSLLSLSSNTVDDAVDSYNKVLYDLLEKYTPLVSRSVAVLVTQPWLTSDITEAKRLKRHCEKLWRKSNLTVHRLEYRKQCNNVKELIQIAKSQYYLKQVAECEGDQKKLFSIVDSLLGRDKSEILPSLTNPLSLANTFNNFFVSKIAKIQEDLNNTTTIAPKLSFDLETALFRSSKQLDKFEICSEK